MTKKSKKDEIIQVGDVKIPLSKIMEQVNNDKEVKEKTSPRMQEIWNSITEFEERGRNCGNSAHVRVPKAWIGKMIKVRLVEE